MCLGIEAAQHIGIPEQFIADNFDRHFPVQPQINGAKNNSHTALPYFFKDLIAVIQDDSDVFGI